MPKERQGEGFCLPWLGHATLQSPLESPGWNKRHSNSSKEGSCCHQQKEGACQAAPVDVHREAWKLLLPTLVKGSEIKHIMLSPAPSQASLSYFCIPGALYHCFGFMTCPFHSYRSHFVLVNDYYCACLVPPISSGSCPFSSSISNIPMGYSGPCLTGCS